jgi:hypothetical protein
VRRLSGPPLGIYVDYLDLAEIHDPQAAVVVCACPSSLQVPQIYISIYIYM